MSLVCEWFVLCERVINDASSNHLTLVTCLEQVNAVHFPAEHHGFGCAARYRWTDAPLETDVGVEYRVLRLSDTDADEVVADLHGNWQAGTKRGRIAVNFQVLRLKRPELLRFRLDHRIGDAEWVQGPTSFLDVEQARLSDEQREALRAELAARGLPTTGLDEPR